MELYYLCVFFIIGTVFGSFFNVVGSRLPNGESIIKPASHCTNCNHYLRALELIPILSFLFQGGKCKKCKTKLSWFYPLYEFTAGILFALSFYLFGFTIDFAIALTFISVLLIIFVSDYYYMIILDEILLIGGAILLFEIWIKLGFQGVCFAFLDGCIAFLAMYLLKKLGDFLFKKESMGGGDIKLLFLFGLVLGYPMAIVSVFLGAMIGLPLSLIILYRNKSNVIPFGPFLSMGALVIFFTKIDFNQLIQLLTK